MKKLLLIAFLALAGCSAEQIETEEKTAPEEIESATVVIYETCPENTNLTRHSVDKPTWKILNAKVNDIPWESQCLLLEFTNLQEQEIRGYYTAMTWPSSWNEE